ncbi:hypothetical protein [Litchfieldia alkalitelluris]
MLLHFFALDKPFISREFHTFALFRVG